ncbi:BREX-1 system adenine-specific DNA-methyltransferase PglX [Actinopolymorpha sp. B17G11]|uniref:BREX-1 system adenine-specific DNA-methyltransferase PglX n=1 Tax=Actinopolymorpha sp. B17G11 TaxID=3160861 RepID=UPI0032E3FA63
METAPLKNFATWARKELIREVTARITAVLAPGSSERVEQAKAVAALEKAVTAAGGGDKGRAAVADKVAYTWFNRIIALRFMDANAYTGIGVVSPQAGVQAGQPEVLAEAKRGVIDAEVVSDATRKAVFGLLDGTLASVDPQGEAYAHLLADYCRYWNRAMSFMFEREGDFTELLIPANLLADDSVPNRAVKVMTEDVCRDVEVIGWLYQFYIAERKAEVFAGFKRNKKAGAAEIPAATQLFTPHWIVRYLVENSVGRLWMLNHPESRLVDQMDYYIAPVDEETDFLKITSPEKLTVIDPACGSGHMLTYAFDLLYAIYEEQGYAPSEIPGLILTHNLYGTEIDPRAGALAAFALTMKARARQRTFFNKPVQASMHVLDPISFTPDELDYLVTTDGDRHAEEAFWNQFAEADTFGSLIQPDPDITMRLAGHLETLDDEGDMLRADALDWAKRAVTQAEVLARQYAVAIANPPYMGSGAMGAELAKFLKTSYPEGKSDLFASFILRCREFAASGGTVSMITMQSWMFIASYEKMRAAVLREDAVTSMLHLGARAFDQIGGEVVSATAFVVERDGDPRRLGTFIRLIDGESERAKRAALGVALEKRTRHEGFYVERTEDFKAIPGSPIVYWLSAAMRAAFSVGKPLGTIGAPKAGMHGGDVNRFARLWYEVSRCASEYAASSTIELHEGGKKWVGLNKGGSFRKWYGNQEYVIAFDRETYRVLETHGNKLPSREYYFMPSVSWSKVSSGAPAFRLYPQGFVFDVAGTPVFSSYQERLNILAAGNSQMAHVLLTAIAPTLNFEIGQIASLPVLSLSSSEDTSRVEALVETSKVDWDSFETSWSFRENVVVSTHRAVGGSLADVVGQALTGWAELSLDQQRREIDNNVAVSRMFELENEVPNRVPLERVSLSRNTAFRWPGKSAQARRVLATEDAVKELISYAVGCMFGRYSLDAQGLMLADQGATLQDYLAKVPSPTFMPDADNVIPIVDGDWFEDDVVDRFRQFLRAAFGEQQFEENLGFVTESLGVKNLRDYFVKSFYKDHVQRYRKRPIYWLFSSPNGSFNALIYIHRYTPSTVSTVLNEYLRAFEIKLEAHLDHHERVAAGLSSASARESAAAQKEADQVRKMLVELRDYERETLYPLAQRGLPVDLDDGVLVNYLRFGAALSDIGLEAKRRDVEAWSWPTNPLRYAGVPSGRKGLSSE